MPYRTTRRLTALLLLVCCGHAAAVLTFDPTRTWQTLDTPHFRIHFHDGLEGVARRTARIAEDVHVTLTRELDWTPRAKTEVVVVDAFDQPNGYATVVPYNMMALFVVPPEPGSQLEVDSTDQWLVDLITHEYTHVLHLDRAHGAPLALRRLLGRNPYSFPNVWQPTWLIEGLATHAETDHAHGVGRGQGAAFAMIMRTEAAAGLRPLAQVSVPNVSWPAGIVPYAYGVFFYQFLTERYGDDAPARFVDAYSGNLIPYRINATARRVFGRDMRALWREYQAWLEARHTDELRARVAAGGLQGRRLTEGGVAGLQNGGNLHVTADGSAYFVRDDGHRRSTLVRRAPDGELTTLVRLNYGARFRVHDTAGIVIAQPEVCREYRVHYDLFLLRHGARRLERLTTCSRYRDAAWSPDGRELAAARIDRGRSRIDLLTADGTFVRTLVDAPDGGMVAQPDWSPDGRRIVFVRGAYGDGANVVELTLDGGRERALTADREMPSHPRYTPDGRAALFTSAHGGSFDVRRVAVDGSAAETLTSVPTGALMAHQGAGGGIHFLQYGARGYDLHVLDDVEPRPMPEPRLLPDRAHRVEPWTATDPVPYTPWRTLLPTSWMPFAEIDADRFEVGVVTFGRDAIGHHRWWLQPMWDVEYGGLIGTASYQWRDRTSVWFTRRNEIYFGGDLVRRNDVAGISWRLPFTRLDRAWNVLAGAFSDVESDRTRAPGLPRFADWRDDVAGLALHYRDSDFNRLSISEQDGRHVRLIAERSIGDSNFDGNVYVLDWREFVTLRRSHVLAARYVIGWGTDAPRSFELGGTTSALDSTFNRRRYALRGYDERAPGLVGRRMELASLEYRFPLALIERGLLFPPVGVHRMSGQVFAEAGRAWHDDRGDWRTAAGAEAVVDITALGWLGFRGRAGYAYGFERDAGGGHQFYFSLGTAF
jgi:hypothetical protein